MTAQVGEPPRLGPRKSSSSALAQLFDDSPFAQENASKKEVLTRLVLYASGLLVSFVIWGLLQERILTKPYAGDYFTSSYGLVFLNRRGRGAVAAFGMRVRCSCTSRQARRSSWPGRGDAAVAARIFRGGRGLPSPRVAATPRPPRGYSVEASRREILV